LYPRVDCRIPDPDPCECAFELAAFLREQMTDDRDTMAYISLAEHVPSFSGVVWISDHESIGEVDHISAQAPAAFLDFESAGISRSVATESNSWWIDS
jgi:hypothetical protein